MKHIAYGLRDSCVAHISHSALDFLLRRAHLDVSPPIFSGCVKDVSPPMSLWHLRQCLAGFIQDVAPEVSPLASFFFISAW